MTAELFIELRCEELPASMVKPALDGLRDGLLSLLEGVDHGLVSTWATPRRLAVAVADVAARRAVSVTEVTGPPADRCYANGVPTKTAIGFARGKGVEVEDLFIVDAGKRGEVVAARVSSGGESVVALVSERMERIIAAVPFAKSMTWGAGSLRFGRPLSSILAIYGGNVILGEAHGIAFSDTTEGHRLTPGPVRVSGSADWLEKLRAHYVEPCAQARRERIHALLGEAAERLGADPIVEEALTDEVVHLVEWPTLVLGAFDAPLLSLPPRLLTTSMKQHQRYYPVHVGGELTHHFVVISNNPFADRDLVAAGNARVLRARFFDARFFDAEDRKQRLETHGERLAGMRWIRGLGTMAHKQARIAQVAAQLADVCGASPLVVRRAAELCKCDLATQMVGEFPELQGHVGALYAQHQGEPGPVAAAIEEHWMPASADSAVPESPAGVTLALAERLDTLAGCFAIGLEPKGGDPQGLRRAALGVVRILLRHGLRLSLPRAIGVAVEALHTQAQSGGVAFDRWQQAQGTGPAALHTEDVIVRLESFILARYEASCVGRGIAADVVAAAVNAAGVGSDLVAIDARLHGLVGLAGSPDFPALLNTLKRALNITRGSDAAAPDRAALSEPAEIALFDAVVTAQAGVSGALERLDVGAAVDAALTLREPVETFFDALMVNDPNPEVAARRLGLLRQVSACFQPVADFARITSH